MNIFYRRHLALFCTIFAVVLIVGCFLSFNIKVGVSICLLIAIALLATAMFLLKRHRPNILKVIFCILFALLSLITQICRMDHTSYILEDKLNTEAEISAKIEDIIYKNSYSSSVIASIRTINNEEIYCKALIDCDYTFDFAMGDVISGSFLVSDIKDIKDNPKYYQADGIALYLYSENNDIIYSHHEDSINIHLNTINKSLVKTIKDNIDGDAGDFISALILGDKSELSDTITRDFRRAGLSHVVAISGMHLSVMMFIFEFLLKKFKINRNIRGGIVILIALFYLGITGFLLSTVRAFIMALFVYTAYLINADNDMLTSLLLALFIILLISPWAVYDIGMWLSFLSIIGIFTASYFINKITDAIYKRYKHVKNKPKRSIKILMYFVSSVLITVFVNFSICFVAWLCFNEISLISVISNIIITPIASILLFLSVIFILFKIIKINFLAVLLAKIIELVCDIMLYAVSMFSSMKGITISLNYDFAGTIITITTVLFAILLIVKLKRKYLIFTPIIACIISFIVCISIYNNYYKEITEIQYINEGESEFILIHDEKDYSIIDITTGSYKYCSDAYYKSIDNCATEISSFVLTHYHSYHSVSLERLFKKAIIRNIVLPTPANEKEYYYMLEITDAANKNGVNVEIYEPGTKHYISKNTAVNLTGREYISRSTHPIFILRVYANDDSLLYVSESAWENAEFKEVINYSISKSSYIIFGAHGPIVKKDLIFENNNINSQIFTPTDNIKDKLIFERENASLYSNIINKIFIFEKEKDLN